MSVIQRGEKQGFWKNTRMNFETDLNGAAKELRFRDDLIQAEKNVEKNPNPRRRCKRRRYRGLMRSDGQVVGTPKTLRRTCGDTRRG